MYFFSSTDVLFSVCACRVAQSGASDSELGAGFVSREGVKYRPGAMLSGMPPKIGRPLHQPCERLAG